MKALLTTVCIVLSAVVVTVHGRSFSFSADNDTRRVIHLGTFAYSSHGVLRIALGAFDIRGGGNSSAEPIGFALDPVANAFAGRQQTNRWDGLQGLRRCFVEDPGAPAQRQLISLQGYGGQSLSRPLLQERTVSTPGYYALFFYNCNGYTNASSTPTSVSFDAHVESLSHTNGHITYASIGNVPLGTIYLLFGIVFTLMAVLWAVQCRREAMQLHAVHSVMTVLIALKAATLFLNAMKEREYVRSGGVSGWDVAGCVFTTLEGTTLFCVLCLLGSGWSVLKATLSTEEKRVIMVLIPCQVVTNVVMAVIQRTSEGHPNWETWRDVAAVLDIVCCCSVLVPLVWTINGLNAEEQVDGNASEDLVRMRSFYVAVVAYIYFTRIVLGLVESMLLYDSAYVTPLLRETITAAFYAYTGYKFRPQRENCDVHLLSN